MDETGVGAARAGATGIDAGSEKDELQRQMEEARERIAQTVTEIKETVTDQYESVKESVAQTFDWREQFLRLHNGAPYVLTHEVERKRSPERR